MQLICLSTWFVYLSTCPSLTVFKAISRHFDGLAPSTGRFVPDDLDQYFIGRIWCQAQKLDLSISCSNALKNLPSTFCTIHLLVSDNVKSCDLGPAIGDKVRVTPADLDRVRREYFSRDLSGGTEWFS